MAFHAKVRNYDAEYPDYLDPARIAFWEAGLLGSGRKRSSSGLPGIKRTFWNFSSIPAHRSCGWQIPQLVSRIPSGLAKTQFVKSDRRLSARRKGGCVCDCARFGIP